MVKFIFVLALIATSLSLSLAGLPRRQGPPVLINRPPPPKPHRYAREANPQGSVVLDVKKPMSGPERRPTYSVDYQHKVFENKHGHFSATGGGVRYPGQRWEPTIGAQGKWKF